jgi:hypothetical protein
MMFERVTAGTDTITHQIEFLKQVVVVMLGLALESRKNKLLINWELSRQNSIVPLTMKFISLNGNFAELLV